MAETSHNTEETQGHISHTRPWHSVTMTEIKAFLGMQLYMVIIKHPQMSLCWVKFDSVLELPVFTSILSCNRFQQIFLGFFFDLCNSSGMIPHDQPGHDKLFKVWELLDLVLPEFEEEYTAIQQVPIKKS